MPTAFPTQILGGKSADSACNSTRTRSASIPGPDTEVTTSWITPVVVIVGPPIAVGVRKSQPDATATRSPIARMFIAGLFVDTGPPRIVDLLLIRVASFGEFPCALRDPRRREC